jgi:MerR family transcriptional regulator, copper efflux regulator
MGLTIGNVARAAEVGVETVRFYERRGLLEQPSRRPSGYRVYPQAAVTRIQFIRRVQELGFTLNEIRELIALEQSGENCDAVRSRATGKIATIENKIRDLERMKLSLEQLLHACAGGQSMRDCAIMNCLDDCDSLPGQRTARTEKTSGTSGPGARTNQRLGSRSSRNGKHG